jgi:MFS family permease
MAAALADQLTQGKMPAAKATTQIVSGVGAIIGCFVGSWFGGRIGRRPAYFGLCLLSLIFCGLLFRLIHEYGTPFLILVGVVGGVTAAFYGWLPLYLPELFPTRVRATGQGLGFNFGRILAAVGALTQGQLVSYYGGSYAEAGAVITIDLLARDGSHMVCPGNKRQTVARLIRRREDGIRPRHTECAVVIFGSVGRAEIPGVARPS